MNYKTMIYLVSGQVVQFKSKNLPFTLIEKDHVFSVEVTERKTVEIVKAHVTHVINEKDEFE